MIKYIYRKSKKGFDVILIKKEDNIIYPRLFIEGFEDEGSAELFVAQKNYLLEVSRMLAVPFQRAEHRFDWNILF